MTIPDKSFTRELRANRKISFDEFINLPYDGLGHQLIKGVHIITPTPSVLHQSLTTVLSHILASFFDKKALGKLIGASIPVKFSEDDCIIPDLVYLDEEELNKQKDQYIDGSPSLIIEILSPSSRFKDYVEKRKLAEKYGVQEYWVVNAYENLIDVFTLQDGKYYTQVFTEKDTLVSKLLILKEFEMSVKELFEKARK